MRRTLLAGVAGAVVGLGAGWVVFHESDDRAREAEARVAAEYVGDSVDCVATDDRRPSVPATAEEAWLCRVTDESGRTVAVADAFLDPDGKITVTIP